MIIALHSKFYIKAFFEEDGSKKKSQQRNEI